MQTDFLIVGQGICGTFLSWYLQQAGRSCIVIDALHKDSASRVAAGIINPVTGRRIVKTWMIDDIMPFAWEAYHLLGQELSITAIEEKNIIDFFPTLQMKMAFEKRYNEDSQFISLPSDQDTWNNYFKYDWGFGKIEPCYLVNLPHILPAYRKVLLSQQLLLEEEFDLNLLQVSESKIQYRDITATKIIFCDGIKATSSPYFQNLPFAPNKGEALLVEIKDLPNTHVFKRGYNLVPWGQPGIFWAGSSYEWEFQSDQPTEIFRERTFAGLQYWLKLPITLLDHLASVRPATLERRPFIGFHPIFPSIGIFNGMGTKGCSLAPFFARQFVNAVCGQGTINPDADIKRFQRILSRNP